MEMDDKAFANIIVALIIGSSIASATFIICESMRRTKIGVDAVKAGLVEQPTTHNGTIWVKPEDYKPYPISRFDSPE